jgi:hypothetical protein
VTSARVGRGCRIIESSIWVATITGFPAALHKRTIIFCAANTWTQTPTERQARTSGVCCFKKHLPKK